MPIPTLRTLQIWRTGSGGTTAPTVVSLVEYLNTAPKHLILTQRLCSAAKLKDYDQAIEDALIVFQGIIESLKNNPESIGELCEWSKMRYIPVVPLGFTSKHLKEAWHDAGTFHTAVNDDLIQVYKDLEEVFLALEPYYEELEYEKNELSELEREKMLTLFTGAVLFEGLAARADGERNQLAWQRRWAVGAHHLEAARGESPPSKLEIACTMRAAKHELYSRKERAAARP